MACAWIFSCPEGARALSPGQRPGKAAPRVAVALKGRERVVCRLSYEYLQIDIADEGPGFVPEDVPDPTEPDNLEKPGGRGIMLMRQYMTNVEYNDLGNAVTMFKRRTAS